MCGTSDGLMPMTVMVSFWRWRGCPTGTTAVAASMEATPTMVAAVALEVETTTGCW
ncbi:unnamed protein product [Symbiodinium microadriaticum]|nr:unnamed protein product [Symbiodinium microadriaticum]CAE7897850.1 unnamed protein product [Symbiodinium sp. KB8]